MVVGNVRIGELRGCAITGCACVHTAVMDAHGDVCMVDRLAHATPRDECTLFYCVDCCSTVHTASLKGVATAGMRSLGFPHRIHANVSVCDVCSYSMCMCESALAYLCRPKHTPTCTRTRIRTLVAVWSWFLWAACCKLSLEALCNVDAIVPTSRMLA